MESEHNGVRESGGGGQGELVVVNQSTKICTYRGANGEFENFLTTLLPLAAVYEIPHPFGLRL